MAYVKLDLGILNSSLWAERCEVRVVFITMLTMTNADGLCEATAPGIARQANVPIEVARDCLAILSAPDPDTRTDEDDGRRVRRVDGGYHITNYRKYDQKDHGAASRKRRQRARERAAEVDVAQDADGHLVGTDQDGSEIVARVVKVPEPAARTKTGVLIGNPPTIPRDGKPAGPDPSARSEAQRTKLFSTPDRRKQAETELTDLMAAEAKRSDRDPVEVLGVWSTYKSSRAVRVDTMSDEYLLRTLDTARAASPSAVPAYVEPPEDMWWQLRGIEKRRLAGNGFDGPELDREVEAAIDRAKAARREEHERGGK